MINVVQIGVGYWGPNLLRNLVASKDFVVSGVIDLSPERRAYVQSQYPGLTVSDRLETAWETAVDAVVIATPAHTHADLIATALQAGKHVFVEKPIATSVAAVDRIAALAASTGKVVMTGHTFLYNSAVRALRQMIDDGELGDVRYIYTQRLNLGQIRSDVDALWNLAPHDVSILQYLLRDPVASAITRNGMAYIQPGIEDTTFLHIQYPGNVMANIHVSWLDPQKIRKVTVVGSKRMVVYDDMADHKLAIYDKGIDVEPRLGTSMDYDSPPPSRFVHRSGAVHMPAITYKEPLAVEMAHYAACIRGETACITNLAHAREVVRILETAASASCP